MLAIFMICVLLHFVVTGTFGLTLLEFYLLMLFAGMVLAWAKGNATRGL
jgi:hypothetical protein